MKTRTAIFYGFFIVFSVVLSGCNRGNQLLKSKNSIDRFALVNRHNVILDEIDPLAPLSLGNGDFAFTADVTGMQTFEEYYYANGIPLETQCGWAWHSFPNVKKLKLRDAMKPNKIS